MIDYYGDEILKSKSIQELEEIKKRIEQIIYVKILADKLIYTKTCKHKWKYLYTGRHGSDAGDDYYECTHTYKGCLASKKMFGTHARYYIDNKEVSPEELGFTAQEDWFNSLSEKEKEAALFNSDVWRKQR